MVIDKGICITKGIDTDKDGIIDVISGCGW